MYEAGVKKEYIAEFKLDGLIISIHYWTEYPIGAKANIAEAKKAYRAFYPNRECVIIGRKPNEQA